MKRTLLHCTLFVFSLMLLSWPGANVLAQNAPKPFASRTPQSAPPPTKNVYEVLAANKKLSKFVELIDDAGLKSMFTGSAEEPVTVFAPTDEAFGDASRDAMKRVKASKTSEQSFVKYHVIANSLVGSGAIRGRKISPSSANGEALMFDGTNKKEPAKVNDATLIESDIPATNGVVHIVSTSLMPPSLKAEPIAAPAKPQPPAEPAAPKVAPATVVSPAGDTTTGSVPMQATTTPAHPPATTTTGAIPEIPPSQTTPVTPSQTR